MKTKQTIIVALLIFLMYTPRSICAENDSTKIVDCFNRLIFEGYNSADYAMFVNNTYYGELPKVGSGFISHHKNSTDLAKNPTLAKELFKSRYARPVQPRKK
jgi:hypothetical protein